jgi:ribosomal protein S21
MTVVIREKFDSDEKMIKRFIKKVKKSGIMEEVMDRRYYIKPSTKKRLKKKKQIADQKKLAKKEKSKI